MAVHAQFGGLAGGCLPCGGSFAEDQMRVLKDYGALLPAAANNGYHCAGVVSGAQSELTCNGSGGGVPPSRKRGRNDADDLKQYVLPSSAAQLPIPAMQKARPVVDSAMTSTSGRPAMAAADVLVSELCRQGAEIDALVRAECERLRAGLEQARKRQCQALVRAAAAAAAQRLTEMEAELDAARRLTAELDERLRQVAAENQAWCGFARSNEAAAAGLRAKLDHLLLRGVAAAVSAEGFGESDPRFSAPPAAADDAQSCCFVATRDVPAETVTAGKWACKACGEGEASVLVLPCRHLCLCKACEPRLDACPVCLAGKNASIHIAAD